MKRSIVRLMMLATTAIAAIGCAMPNEAECPRLAKLIPGHHHNNLPPAQILQHPGPGVEGPGPGVLTPASQIVFGGPGVSEATSQVAFLSPEGMTVTWDISGVGQFDSEALVAPGRYNFPQGAIYRLKITNIQGRAGVELYPTLEIGPATARTEAYLAHNAIPFQLTEEDLDQVLTGNFVTKVIYLPDPEYQELALAGVETLVSTRLDPGVDPIVEADRRGSIMAIIRIGNKDLEIPGTRGDSGVSHASYMQAGPGGPIQQVGFHGPIAGHLRGPAPAGGIPPSHVVGVTAPSWGMPMVGTPIGLPGPPHVPLGIPAGLQQHRIVNKTHMNIPGPTEAVRISVKQHPGMSYPKPVSHVHIKETNYNLPAWFHQPLHSKIRCVHGVNVDECAECGECQ